MHEVIEMPRLERSVLAVVSEGQELAWRPHGTFRVTQERGGQHGGGAAARLAGEGCKLAKLALAHGVKFTAFQAQGKRRSLPPHLDRAVAGPRRDLSTRRDPHSHGNTTTPGRRRPAAAVAPLF